MKYFNKRSVLLSITAIMGYLCLNNAAGTATSGNGDRTGSPFAYAGAPTCSSAGSCHNQSPGSFNPTVTMQLLSGITPVTSYVPGNTYTLVITINASNTTATTRYGFQTVAVKASNYGNIGLWGSLPSGFTSPVVGSRVYVEQSSPQSSPSVNLTWTAPAAGTGTVNFYASGLVANNNALATGDNSANDSLIIPEYVVCTPPTVTPSVSLVSCHNGNNGAISLTVTGGTTPYIFNWTGPAGFTSTAQNISNLAPGTYKVYVTGGTCTDSSTITLSNPALLTVSGAATDTLCEGDSLILGMTVNGGTPPYSYLWSGPNSFSATTLNTVVPAAPITDSGLYTLTVSDANGCSKAQSVHVVINPGIILQANATSPLCNGAANGNINMFPSGTGNQPFIYAWTGPAGFTASSSSIANLAPGTYTLLASQTGGGCTQTYTATLINPPALTATASVNNVPVCLGNVLSLTGTASGGTGTLSYHWTGPTYFSNNQNPTVTNNAGYGNSGVYTLGVTDANNCTASSVVNVTVDTVPTVTATAVAALCMGASSGAVNVTASGGSPFTYAYTGPNGFTANTQNVSNVAAGTYSVTVTSSAGCKTTKTATVTQPSTSVTGSATSNTPICNNGTLNLYAAGSGGTGAISYSWSGPSGFTSALQNPTIYPATAANMGTYTLTITDANGCTYVTTTNVALAVLPVVTATVTNPACYGANTGSIVTQVTGGAPPFIYAWTGPNGYTSSVANPTNLAPGTYTVSVSGICSGLGGTSVIVTQPAAITDTVYGNSPACAGTVLTLNTSVNGGTGFYNYSWTGPNNFISTSQTPVIPAVTTAASGLYTLVIRDANNCIKTSQYNVVVDTVPVIKMKDTTYCPGSSVTLDAGNSGASYLWSTGATTRTVSAGSTGTYTVIVTNTYGCPATKSVQVSAGNLPAVDSVHGTVMPTNPGGFTFTAANPRNVNTYVWDFGDGNTAVAQSPVHFYTATGTYTIKLYAINVCGVDTVIGHITVTAVTGVANIANASDVINVYPNPTRDYVMIDNNSGITLKSVKVINVMGAKMYESAVDNKQSFRVNTNAFAPGIYTLYIETSGGTVVRKLEIMK